MLSVISFFVLNNLWKDSSDLGLEESDQLLPHLWLQVVLDTEISCKGISCVSFEDHDSFNSILSDVNVDVKFWVSLVNSVFDLVQLLVNKIFWVFLVDSSMGALVMYFWADRFQRLVII
jgi:hypothetical protein